MKIVIQILGRIRFPRNGSEDPDPEPYHNETDPKHLPESPGIRFRANKIIFFSLPVYGSSFIFLKGRIHIAYLYQPIDMSKKS